MVKKQRVTGGRRKTRRPYFVSSASGFLGNARDKEPPRREKIKGGDEGLRSCDLHVTN